MPSPPIALLALVLLVGCDCSSSAPRDAALPLDAAADALVAVDSGSPEPWECAAELCCPPLEDRTDRSESDSRLRRDLDRARGALSSCIGGEDCTGVTFTVDASGVVDAVTAVPPNDTPDDQTCVEEALLGLCLPALVGMGEQEAQLCGI